MNFDQSSLQGLHAQALSALAVYDIVDDTVFFVKNHLGQYAAVNETILRRCSLKSKAEIIGKTARDIFPGTMGESFLEQDLQVIQTQVPIRAALELHKFPDGKEGWCLTWKAPLIAANGVVQGIAGFSRDLGGKTEADGDLRKVAKALEYINTHLDQNVQIEELASLSGLSAFQLDSRIRNLFGFSTGQFITKARIDLASVKLKNSNQPIVEIARSAGYTDASAFTRQFRKMVGATPTAYRSRHRHAESPY